MGAAAIDVTVRDPLKESGPVKADEIAKWHHAQELEKCGKYVIHTNRAKWQFKPFVCDVWGGLGEEAYNVTAHLVKAIVSQKEAWQRREAEGLVWQTLSFAPRREIGKQLAMEPTERLEPGKVSGKRPRPLPHHCP